MTKEDNMNFVLKNATKRCGTFRSPRPTAVTQWLWKGALRQLAKLLTERDFNTHQATTIDL